MSRKGGWALRSEKEIQGATNISINFGFLKKYLS